MSSLPIPWRRLLFSCVLACTLISSIVAGVMVKSHLATAHADGNNRVPAKYAFVVILDGGHPELYNATNAPFLTSLKASSATYTNAQAQVPAHSITNIMGLFTGTDASHHGFPYETFWDRQYNHLIELDETPVLPPGITQDRNCRACMYPLPGRKGSRINYCIHL